MEKNLKKNIYIYTHTHIYICVTYLLYTWNTVKSTILHFLKKLYIGSSYSPEKKKLGAGRWAGIKRSSALAALCWRGKKMKCSFFHPYKRAEGWGQGTWKEKQGAFFWLTVSWQRLTKNLKAYNGKCLQAIWSKFKNCSLSEAPESRQGKNF